MRSWWVVTLVCVAACQPATSAGPRAESAPAPATTTVSGAPSPVSSLDSLVVADRVPTDSYRRDAFGSAWSDIDGNGCNQRDDVLLRDAVPGSTTVAPQGRCDHDVLAGTWVDPYTGRSQTFDDMKDQRQSQAVQIDHVVPLAEAWVSGAAAWSEERRLRFANDLDELLAVDGPTNASKGSDDPAAWRPRKAYQCAYATRWVDIKTRWRLTVDPSEKRALTEMLGFC